MSKATKLPNEKRAENYIRQNLQHRGKAALSNRQIRRLKRHDNLQKIQQVAKATFKTDEEKPAPIEPEVTLSEPTVDEIIEEVIAPAEDFPVTARPCGGTDHCVTPSGKKTKTHKKCEAFA